MRFLSIFLLALLLASGASATAQTKPPVDIVHSAQIAIEHLEKAEYAAVVAMFSLRLRDRLPEPKVRETWEGLHRSVGRLKYTADPVQRTKDNLRRVIVPAQFERSKMEIEIVFNADGDIAGLLLHRK